MTGDDAIRALADCRDRINAIDRRLVALLNERTRIVQQIEQTAVQQVDPVAVLGQRFESGFAIHVR